MIAPLKVTTDFSLLKSLIKIDDLISFCIEKNIKECAICDSNLFGSIEFYKKCISNNIKPIIGLELNINDNIIYLYAENYDGYKNMLKINSLIFDGLITIDILKKYKENVLLVVPYKYINIIDTLDFYNNRYIGYKNEYEEQNSLIKGENVIYINDIKVLDAKDIKYLNYLDKLAEREEVNYQDCYYNSKIEEPPKNREVISKLNLEMPINTYYIPKYKENIDSFELLSKLCFKGLQKRLNNNVTPNYVERLKYELSVINKMGYVDYFLIVYDYVLYAKKNNILVGPGRGSAAGSLVSYVIGITDIDPIKYNLLFERFLNYERVSMPDIDIDFENLKREDVINYVKNKYGHNNVSGGLTWTTYKTRLVLRDVSKLLKVDDRLLNKFIKVVNRDISLSENLNKKEVKEYLNSYSELKKVYEISLHLEGLKKNISTHAAGIVIADRPLDDIIPMYKKEDIYLTGIDLVFLEDMGLLKMDFLAIRNLSTISAIINKIDNFKLSEIPLDDKHVYKLFCEAKTDGIFQFETYSFKNILPKFRPKNFSELIALIALNRPGPSQELESYIKRKDNKEKITYYHESLKDILEETYGVIVYQEQVINILVRVAKFSYAEADNIRRAMSKKKESIILEEKDNFIKRATANGYSTDIANDIFNHILKFASYGFNKSHSVSYATVSYWMAYLKVHYNTLFTFELLNNSLGSSEQIKKYLNELKSNDIKIEKTSINYSEKRFGIKYNYLFLPFKLIRGFRSETIDKIVSDRETLGIYKDIFDFFGRTSTFLTRNEYIMLINASALREFKINNKTLMENLDSLINYGSIYNELKEFALKPEINYKDEYEENKLRDSEINSYGFFISNHPASKYNGQDIVKLNNINNHLFKNIICYVMVESIHSIKTKKGEDMAFLTGSDETGYCDFTVFPKNYNLLQNINKNDIIKIWGQVSKRYDKISVVVNNIIKE